VGANPKAFAFWEKLKGCVVRIIEIWKPNCEALKAIMGVDAAIDLADIRTVDITEHYDLAVWWHGPEHVESNEVRPCLEKLEACADHVLIGCPWGDYPQGPIDGNPHEEHRNPLNPRYFEKKGYTVVTDGEPVRGTEKQGGQIAAWK